MPSLSISETDKTVLGFFYDPCVFSTVTAPDTRSACFRVRKVLEGIVYDTVALEDNPFTFPEVKTLLAECSLDDELRCVLGNSKNP